MILAALLAIAQAAPATLPPDDRCWRQERRNGLPVRLYRGDRACLEFDEPRRFEGIWLNDFEGSRFVEGARTLDDVRRDETNVWLDRHDLLKPSSIAIGHYGRAHRMTFVGRSAKAGTRKPFEGYGHFSMSGGLILLDELIEQTDIGPTADAYPRR